MFWSYLLVADLVLFWLWHYSKTGLWGSWLHKLHTSRRKKSLSSYYLSKLLSPKVRSMYPLYQPYIRMLLGLISLNNEILSFCKNVRKLDRWKMIPGYLTFHFFISDVGYFPVSSYLKSNLRVIWSWSLLIHWVWGIYYFNF